MINKAILLGNLGKDPELKQINNRTFVCNFSLATVDSVKKNDKWENVTEWHNITTFGSLAENCSKFLKKGSKAYVEGKIQTRKYTDKDGVEKYSFSILANTVKFLDPRESNTPKSNSNIDKQLNLDDDKEDLPF